MKNKILGLVGVLWGGLIVLNWLLIATDDAANGAYETGSAIGALFGGAMFLVGLFYLFKKPRQDG